MNLIRESFQVLSMFDFVYSTHDTLKLHTDSRWSFVYAWYGYLHPSL